MKKHSKSKIIMSIALVIIVIGSISLGAGIMQGGSFKYLSINHSTASWWPFNGEISLYDVHDTSDSFSKPLMNTKNIHLEVYQGDIEIIKGTEDKITFYNYEESKVNMKDNKTETTIEIKEKPALYQNQKVVIELKNQNADSVLFVKNNMGNVFISKLKFATLSIDCNLGNLDLEDIQSYVKTTLSVDAGNIDVTDSICSNNDFENNTGNITFDGDLQNKSKISLNLGNVELSLNGAEETYGYHVKVGLGNADVGENYVTNESITRNESAKNFMEVKNDMGNIDISFD